MSLPCVKGRVSLILSSFCQKWHKNNGRTRYQQEPVTDMSHSSTRKTTGIPVCVCQIRLIIYLPRMCLLNVTVVLLCKQWIIYLSYPLTPCSPVWQTVCFWKGPPPTDWTNTSQFLITCLIDLYYPASHLQSKINRNRK